MVEKKEDLGNAIALNSMMFNGARLIGPSIAGMMLATAGEGICFLINAISYVFVVVSLLLMHVKKKEVNTGIRSNMLNDMKEGFNYTFGFAPIKHLLILLGVVSLMGSSYQVLMPVFAKGDASREVQHIRISYGSCRLRRSGRSRVSGFTGDRL